MSKAVFRVTYSETIRYSRLVEAETESEALEIIDAHDAYTAEYRDDEFNNDDAEVEFIEDVEEDSDEV